MYVGKEGKGNVYVCRVGYKGGTHPGKIAPNGNCYIGYGGKERGYKSGYQTMNVNRGGLHNYTGLVNQYRAAKTSVAERDSSAKYSKQVKILNSLRAELNKAPKSGAVRKEIERNYKAVPKQEQLNPVFLANQEKELKAMRTDLLKLQKDPASPCGQAIKDAGVKPSISTKPGSGGFAGLEAMRKVNKAVADQIQAAMKVSATAVTAANAARALQQKQAEARKQQQTDYKKKRLLAFTEKLKKREARIASRAEKTAKVRQARAKIVSQNAKPQPKAVASAKLAAEKAQQAANAARPKSKAFAKLNKAQTQAFARAYTAKPAPKKGSEVTTKISPERLARREARMAKRLANVGKMNAQQKKAFAVAYAKARARGRADMLKNLPVSRTTTIVKKAGAPATERNDRAGVDTTMLRNLATLKNLAR